jgi:hypothetical protein
VQQAALPCVSEKPAQKKTRLSPGCANVCAHRAIMSEHHAHIRGHRVSASKVQNSLALCRPQCDNATAGRDDGRKAGMDRPEFGLTRRSAQETVFGDKIVSIPDAWQQPLCRLCLRLVLRRRRRRQPRCRCPCAITRSWYPINLGFR